MNKKVSMYLNKFLKMGSNTTLLRRRDQTQYLQMFARKDIYKCKHADATQSVKNHQQLMNRSTCDPRPFHTDIIRTIIPCSN